jgi:hypothetical protein
MEATIRPVLGPGGGFFGVVITEANRSLITVCQSSETIAVVFLSFEKSVEGKCQQNCCWRVHLLGDSFVSV